MAYTSAFWPANVLNWKTLVYICVGVLALGFLIILVVFGVACGKVVLLVFSFYYMDMLLFR